MPRAVRDLLLLTPLATMSLSANGVPFDKYIAFGPLLEGKDVEMQLSLDPRNYPLDWYVYADAKAEDIPLDPAGLKQSQISSLPVDPSTGKATFSASLPGMYMETGKRRVIEMGIAKVPYYRGIDRSLTPFCFFQGVEANKGRDIFFVDEEGIFETQNRVYHFDEANPGGDFVHFDSYDVKGLCDNRDLSGRKVPLDELYVDYYGFGMAPKASPSAELRILDNLEDFEGVAIRAGSFLSLPLSVRISDLGSGHYRYRFALSRDFYYSRIDYKAYTREPMGEPWFRSTDLYLPLRLRHDDALYRYHIVISGAGAFGDTLVMDNRAMSTRAFFGNCLEAEYCVVPGVR